MTPLARSWTSRLPLKLRRVESRRLTWPGGAKRVATRGIGFLGAADEDRHRWLALFRSLLDGVGGDLQMVLAVRPGSRLLTESPARPRPDGVAEMRRADLDYADRLASSPEALLREVTVVASGDRPGRTLGILGDLGVIRPGQVGRTVDSGHLEVQETANACRSARGWHRSWYLDRFPGTDLEAGWLLNLLPPGLELSLAWHARPLPSGWVVAYLQRQLTTMRAGQLLGQDRGITDPLLEGAVPTTVDLQRRLAANQDRAFHVSVYVTLTSPSRDELDRGSERVDSAAQATLCHLRPCTFRMADGLLATIPIGCDRIQRQHVLDTSSLVTLFPWLDTELRQSEGIVIGSSQATGRPVQVDPFDADQFENANIGVFGHSGAGKTYLLSTLLMGALGIGAQVFVIDPEREYGRLAEALGGTEVNLTLGSHHALNVMAPRPAAWPDDVALGATVADAADLVSIVCGGIDEAERARVEEAISGAYAEHEEPVLRDVAARIPPDSRTARVLGRWISGSLGRIFSSPTNVDLEAPIVSFALRELREELVAPVHFLIAEALWSRVKARDRRRLLVVDELGLLFEDPTIRRFVVSLARRIRKYDGALVFATQNPGDLLGSEAGAVVATNPALQFFGALRPGEAAKIQRTFQLSDSQRTRIESARRGEFLLAAGPERLAVQIRAPTWQEQLMVETREGAV